MGATCQRSFRLQVGFRCALGAGGQAQNSGAVATQGYSSHDTLTGCKSQVKQYKQCKISVCITSHKHTTGQRSHMTRPNINELGK